MLNRKYLIAKKEFSIIYKRAKNVDSKNIFIKYLPNHKDFSQFGVVISKKKEKLAVKRNRLRRVIKSEIYKHLDDICTGYYIVIYLKKNVSEDILRNELIDTIKLIQR